MVYSVAWNEASPAGASTNANTLDTELQNLKISIRERMDNILHASGDWGTDGEEPKLLDVLALAGTPEVAVVWHNANQTVVSGTPLDLAWNQELLDTGGFHDNSTNPERFTIVEAGYYRITTSLRVTAGAAAGQFTCSLLENGVSIRATSHPSINLDIFNIILTEIVLAAAADEYRINVSHATGVNMLVAGVTVTQSTFQIERINGTT